MRRGRRRRITWALLALLAAPGAACSGSSAITSTQVAGPAVSPQSGGLMYYLPKRVVELAIWRRTFFRRGTDGDDEVLEQTPYAIVVDAYTVPDRNYLMRLAYHPSPSFHDVVKVRMSPDGLLTDVTTSLQDESPAIVAKLAELAGAIAQVGVPRPKSQPPRPGIEEIHEQLATVVLDPTDAAACEAELGKYGIRLTAVPMLGSTDPGCALTPAPPCTPLCQQSGVCYRPVIPFRMTVTPGGVITGTNIRGYEPEILVGGTQNLIMLPNRSPVVCYPIERTAFVRRSLRITFERGLLTSMESDKPSEILGFLQIPIDVAKAIVSIPGELLQLRVTHLNQSKAVTAAEAAALQSLQQLQQTKATAAPDDGGP